MTATVNAEPGVLKSFGVSSQVHDLAAQFLDTAETAAGGATWRKPAVPDGVKANAALDAIAAAMAAA